MVTKISKWVSLPVLLMASMFSDYAAGYELLVDFVICLGAVIFVQRAVRLKEYFWAAGLVAVAVVFSPFLLGFKIFLLMGFTCIATLVTCWRHSGRNHCRPWHPRESRERRDYRCYSDIRQFG